MPSKKISQLEEISEIHDDDLLVIVDVSAETTNKITKTNFLKAQYEEIQQEIEEIQNEIFYKPGDTYSTTFTPLSGFITTGSTEIQVTLTVPKRLDNITSMTLTDLRAQVRGINGYLNNDGNVKNFLTDTAYTKTLGIRNENTIIITITKSSAFTNATNNTPVSLACYIGITFN